MLSGYFSATLTTCIFIAVLLNLAHPRLKSASVFGAGILLVCVIMLPLVDIISDFDINDSLDKLINDMQYEQMGDDAIELAFERGIAEYVADEYGVSPDNVAVCVDGFDMGALTAERIYVTLSGRAALLDYKSIEDRLADEFTRGGECEVTLKIG